jgi:hypothetical protein
VKVLFDQGTPVPLRRALPGHDVSTAYEMGWSTLMNGELLAAAEAAGFAAIVTTDTRGRAGGEKPRAATGARLAAAQRRQAE